MTYTIERVPHGLHFRSSDGSVVWGTAQVLALLRALHDIEDPIGFVETYAAEEIKAQATTEDN
jgi:hypothetical protein